MEKKQFINTITLSHIQNELASYLTQTQFLKKIFPPFLNEADETGLLYFIFSDDKGNARTKSVFMNGNYKYDKKKNIYTRCQANALNFIAKMLENKDMIIQWADFLKLNYPNLKADNIRSMASIDINNYPEQFHDIILQETNQYYLLLYILCWSFFGEQIERCKFKTSSKYSNNNTEVVFNTYESFYEYMFSEKDNIECIEIACHSGYKWLYDTKRITMLTDYLSNGGKLHLIINSVDAVETIACHIRNPEKYYIGFKENIDNWKRFADRHPESVELVVSNIPILHSYVNFRAKISERSRMIVIFYTYSNSNLSKNHLLFLNYDSPHYTLFQEEFDYLWKNKDYKR